MDDEGSQQEFFNELSQKIYNIIQKECEDNHVDMDDVVFQYFVGAYSKDDMFRGATGLKTSSDNELEFMLDKVSETYEKIIEEEDQDGFWNGFSLN